MHFEYKLTLTASRTSFQWSYTDGTFNMVRLIQTAICKESHVGFQEKCELCSHKTIHIKSTWIDSLL
jgi:hypothetical protein